jgi:hypothetical protein
MGNISSNATFTITFNAKVYDKIISEIPERVDELIKNINDNPKLEQSNLELFCRRFINRVVNDNLGFLSKLDSTYIAGLSVGLTAYIQTLEQGVNDITYRDLIINYVKRIISIINTQQRI